MEKLLSWPKWVKVIFSIGLFVIFFVVIISCYRIYSCGYSLENVLSILLLFFVFLAGNWIGVYYVFITIKLDKRGVSLTKLFSQNVVVAWGDIVEVKCPSLLKSSDFRYIISRNGEKILIPRSLEGYDQLIETIKKNSKGLRLCES